MNQGWDIITILSALHFTGDGSQEPRGELVVNEERKRSMHCDHLGHSSGLQHLMGIGRWHTNLLR